MTSPFAHHEDAVWKKLSDELDGNFDDQEGWRQDRIVAHVEGWTVIIDLHSEAGYKSETIYTRLRAAFRNPTGFRFNIFQQTIFGDVAKLLGTQDVATGHADIDKAFMIKATDEAIVKTMLESAKLRAMLLGEPECHLFVRASPDDDAPEGTFEVVLEVEGEVLDVDRLKNLYVLFAQALHRLGEIGVSAGAAKPS
ncbi:MAG: hypothetical protein GC162_01705 [Planctomycetes bacterium]|nr:hypothetical protein [Planctomycetota bacterium]